MDEINLSLNKYEQETALKLANLSYNIYQSEEKRDKNSLYFSITQKINNIAVDLQFSVYKKDKQIIIVFKGSQELTDWSTNSKITKQKFLDDEVHVHAGFGSSLELFLTTVKSSERELDGIKIKDLYKELLKKDSEYTLLITGHSLGGAIATLFSAYLKHCHMPKEQMVCYTFGAPPVAWLDFYSKYKDLNLHRITNQFDPVPKINRVVTLKSLQHVGELKEFPSDEYEHHSVSQYISNIKKESHNTLKRGKAVDMNILKNLIKLNRGALFLVLLVFLTFIFGMAGFQKSNYSFIDSIYMTFNLLTMNYTIKHDLNWQLEIARFTSLVFVFSAIIKTSLLFLHTKLTQPFKLSRNKNHIVIFGFNGHIQELIKDINKKNSKTEVVVVSPQELDLTLLDIEAETVTMTKQLSVKFMKMLALHNAEKIICMTMDDDLDLTHANGVIEYLEMHENTELIKLYIHLHSYTLPDLFNFENYHALLGKMPCDIKIFNHYDNAVRILFQNNVMEEYLSSHTTHWLLQGEWNQKIAFMRYVAQIAYYEDEALPKVTLICNDVNASKKELSKLFPKLEKTLALTLTDNFNEVEQEDITHIAVLYENSTKGLEEALVLNGLYKEQPIFLQQRESSLINNDKIIPFGFFIELNTSDIIFDEVLDRRAQSIHNYYRDLYGMEPWKELSLFKKNSNRMQAEHINIKLRGIGWSEEDDFSTYEDFLAKNPDIVEKWARIEHLRWNAFHYVNGWDYAKERNDAKKLHNCLVPFSKLSKKDQGKDFPAILEIPTFIKK